MKPSDPLLLADVTLRCGMYPAGKVAISWYLATIFTIMIINYGSVWLEDSTVELEREEEMKRNTCILQWVQKIVWP